MDEKPTSGSARAVRCPSTAQRAATYNMAASRNVRTGQVLVRTREVEPLEFHILPSHSPKNRTGIGAHPWHA